MLFHEILRTKRLSNRVQFVREHYFMSPNKDLNKMERLQNSHMFPDICEKLSCKHRFDTLLFEKSHNVEHKLLLC